MGFEAVPRRLGNETVRPDVFRSLSTALCRQDNSAADNSSERSVSSYNSSRGLLRLSHSTPKAVWKEVDGAAFWRGQDSFTFDTCTRLTFSCGFAKQSCRTRPLHARKTLDSADHSTGILPIQCSYREDATNPWVDGQPNIQFARPLP